MSPCLPFIVLPVTFALAAATASATPPNISEPDANGFRWATIDHPGNAPYDGPSPYGSPRTFGRGSVDYVYRIAQSEITSAQWVEFVNTFSTQADFPQQLFGYRSFAFQSPGSLGIWLDPDYTGPGRRYITTNPDGEDVSNLPVRGMSWREAAMYCNWLHNGKSSDRASLWGGAYDTTTWGTRPRPDPLPGFSFTDSLTHEPGARYWIPTLDEWMKAAFFDPNKYGPGQAGWWTHLNASDSPPISGLPGTPGATTSGGIDDGFIAASIPLGAYPNALSPWGLLDTASGGDEWLQEPVFIDLEQTELTERGLMGVYAGDFVYVMNSHASMLRSNGIPDGSLKSLRLATVPSPTTSVSLFMGLGILGVWRKRRIM